MDVIDVTDDVQYGEQAVKALRAQVARLEGELTEARQLAHTEAEQRVGLRAANAALAAAGQDVLVQRAPMSRLDPVYSMDAALAQLRAALIPTEAQAQQKEDDGD